MAVNGFAGLPRSQQRVDMLMADFSGLDHLEDIVNKVLDRLRGSAKWPSGMSRETFDATFAEVSTHANGAEQSDDITIMCIKYC